MACSHHDMFLHDHEYADLLAESGTPDQNLLMEALRYGRKEETQIDFVLSDEEYQAASGVISDARKAGRIVAADPKQGRKNARYVPYWERV